MHREQIPVTREVIKWARERAGYSLEEIRREFREIEIWEDPKAEKYPSYPQLERLSDKFKVPIAVFFFPEPPTLPSIEDSFRTLPESVFGEIPRQVQFLLRKAKALQLNLLELCSGQNPSNKKIWSDLDFPIDIDIQSMAKEIRDYIGISLEDQRAWDTSDEALKQWRRALHGVGIFVFKDAFRVPNYSGFCLYDDVFPIIYVNNSSSKNRQIFTLFHEMAHLIFGTSGIDTVTDKFIPSLPDQARRIEVLCNRFAAEFLVPDSAFKQAIKGLEISEGLAEKIADQFNVSRELIYRKFLDRGLISKQDYEEAAANWTAKWVDQRSSASGGNPYWTQISYLGRDYMGLALSQYHQNRINESQLAEYLNWKPKNIGTLEEYYHRGEQ